MDVVESVADIELEIKGTDAHQRHSEVLQKFYIPIDFLLEKNEIYRYIKADNGPSVLVHARQIRFGASDPMVFARLKSTRLEIVKQDYHPGETVKGCLVYAANRNRVFSRPMIRLIHYESTQQTGTVFDVTTTLPNKFKKDKDNNERFHVPAGIYMWPFEFRVPMGMPRCNSHGNSSAVFEMRVGFEGSKVKVMRLGVEQNAIPSTAPKAPDVELFFDAPQQPDNPNTFLAPDPAQIDRIPSSSICCGVRKALYGPK